MGAKSQDCKELQKKQVKKCQLIFNKNKCKRIYEEGKKKHLHLWLLITHHNTGNDSGVFVDTSIRQCCSIQAKQVNGILEWLRNKQRTMQWYNTKLWLNPLAHLCVVCVVRTFTSYITEISRAEERQRKTRRVIHSMEWYLEEKRRNELWLFRFEKKWLVEDRDFKLCLE